MAYSELSINLLIYYVRENPLFLYGEGVFMQKSRLALIFGCEPEKEEKEHHVYTTIILQIIVEVKKISFLKETFIRIRSV